MIESKGEVRAPLVAQTVKNPPAMQETWVRSLGWKDLLEEGMATHSSILVWRIPVDREAWRSQRVRQDCVTKRTHELKVEKSYFRQHSQEGFSKVTLSSDFK